METSSIRIMAQPSADGKSCEFAVDRPLLEGGAWFFRTAEDAASSPLPAALLGLGDVSGVFVSDAKLTVHREGDPSRDWPPLAKEVGRLIREHLGREEDPVDPKLLERSSADDAIRARVQDLLDREINPMVASHGGWIAVRDVREGDLHLEMGGGCQGCGSATATLRQGVERLLRDEIPDLGRIFDATDHAAGENPFIAPAG